MYALQILVPKERTAFGAWPIRLWQNNLLNVAVGFLNATGGVAKLGGKMIEASV